MCWRIDHRFGELEGKAHPFLNQALKHAYIDQAFQVIDFKLDKGGAELKSQAGVAVKEGPRSFYLNRPYLIYLQKRGVDHPFFVVWVENTELMLEAR